MTHPISQQSPALQRLNALLGDWNSSITYRSDPSNVIHGHASVDWLEPALFGGNYFLAFRSIVDHPAFPKGFFIVAVDDAGETYTAHYFDSRGITRLYQMTLNNGVWKLGRDDPDFPQRYTGTLSDDGRTITGYWEKSKDGTNWEHDFDLVYTKVE